MGKNQTEGHAKTKPAPSEVVFHTYPKLLFIWPIIVVGLLFWPLAGIEGADRAEACVGVEVERVVAGNECPIGATELDGVYAVGDIVRGASLVVWAIRDGRDCAEAILKKFDAAKAVAAE